MNKKLLGKLKLRKECGSKDSCLRRNAEKLCGQSGVKCGKLKP